MEKKVSFDKNLMIALEKAEEIIIKEFLSHANYHKYRKRYEYSIGEKSLKRYFKIIIKIRKTEKFHFQYKLIFTDFYNMPVEIAFKSEEFDLKRFRENFCDNYNYAFDYQNLESRP